MALKIGINQGKIWRRVNNGTIIPDGRDGLRKKAYLFLESRQSEIAENIKSSLELSYKGRQAHRRYSPEQKAIAKEIYNSKGREHASWLWKTSPKRRCIHRLRARIHKALTRVKCLRPAIKSEALVGCSIIELRNHFESKFRDGMNWGNYGKGGWVIDHKNPICNFDLSKKSQQKICFHYTNLQPLWESENRSKGGRLSV